MNLKNKNILFCLTGSFFYFKNTISQMKELVKENISILPVMSYNAYKVNFKYGKAKKYIDEIENITGNEIIHTIYEAEQIGINNFIDVIIVAPCTGNTLAKLSTGIADTPVLVAVKSYLKHNIPIVIGISANDGLSTNAENIGKLLNRKNYFFIPFRQTNPITKPYSIGFEPKYIKATLEFALDKEQIQPILL